MVKITFRPHHFLCTLAFQGKGYSPKFIRNYQAIVKQLQHDEDTVIEVTTQTDSICKECPFENQGTCKTEPKIQQIDQAHMSILNLKSQDHITWKEAKKRLKDQMTLAHFHHACAPCQWKKLGLCQDALQQLQHPVDSCYSHV